MRISVTGINHQTAPVAVREKIAVNSGGLGNALLALKTSLPHGVILSTCNRTELYTAGPDNTGNPHPDLKFLQPDMSGMELSGSVYTLNDKAAAEHLFRVAAGLDSMMVGEYEVLGQVNNALKTAEKAGMVHLPLRQLFYSAVRVGRRVREETGISRNAVSVSSAAVEIAMESYKNIAACKLVVIGTGEAGRLVALAAKERGISCITVIGRTEEKAKPLAQRLDGIAAGMSALEAELVNADIIVSCSNAPHYTLDLGQVKQAMSDRAQKPLLIMDISVPRNIEPAVSRIAGVCLYNIDDITRVSRGNLELRKGEINKAELILAEELASFNVWRQEYEVRPVIKAMMHKAETARKFHLEATFSKLPDLTETEKHRLDMMTKAMIKKILSDPIGNLKNNGNNGCYYAEAVKQLFRLEVQEQE